jgi:hypothetical protein
MTFQAAKLLELERSAAAEKKEWRHKEKRVKGVIDAEDAGNK